MINKKNCGNLYTRFIIMMVYTVCKAESETCIYMYCLLYFNGKYAFYIYRIASNKRPTSRKRLPLINAPPPPFFSYYFINAPFLKGKNVRNEEKKLLFFYYHLQKYRNGCNAVFRIRRRKRNCLRWYIYRIVTFCIL